VGSIPAAGTNIDNIFFKNILRILMRRQRLVTGTKNRFGGFFVCSILQESYNADMRTPTTLTIIHHDDKVLLGMKKRGFGMGRWNGFGGKLETGETVEEAAKREMLQESGITIREMEKVAKLDFEFHNKPGDIIEVNIFRIKEWHGEPTEGEEMKPQWFHTHEIPFASMWPDDRYWMPLFLANKKFEGRFLFGPNDSVLEYALKVC
jgi:8-oxo-dGTP diphosphatase/2-hydroxy-dATP diphosphatase